MMTWCPGRGWLVLAAVREGAVVADRLLVDLSADGQVTVSIWPEGEAPEAVSHASLGWPLGNGALEDLRWYLEDYLRAPFGVWEDRGPQIQEQLDGWGEAVFGSVFGSGPARYAYERARDRRLELVFRSGSPELLGLPWELMRDPSGPVVLNLAGVSRSLPVADLAKTVEVPGGRLRVLIVISRPGGTEDPAGYRIIARPLLERLDAVRGEVDLVVLRPPTLDALREVLAGAVEAREPFHVVHFDGHGVMPGRAGGGVGRSSEDRPGMLAGAGREGVLAFEKPRGGADDVEASKIAALLKDAGVPVVVLNACQSGAIGADLGAAVATALLRSGIAAVVAMAYSVYAVAAAEFMAAFYEALFAGQTVGAAVTAGRRRMYQHDRRPSPKGELPLADWLVPVHYLRRDVSFGQARAARPAGAPSLDAMLNQLRQPGAVLAGGAGSLDPVGVFVGRDDLFYELETAARLQKVVVLHGPGGTGKTEVAKAFGRWWRDTGGVDRPEWVVWQSFEAGVASFGLDAVITQVGLAVWGSGFARADLGERRQVTERLLAERRLLLIWDNFETVKSMLDPAGATLPLDDAECAELKDFLVRLAGNPHCRSAVLITSRTDEAWLGGVGRIRIGGLAAGEAIEYANDLLAPYPNTRARRARRAFGELLDWLDGHPLSMRLILPRLDTTDPEVLLAGLRGTVPLPGGDDPGGDRLTSLAASISYSFTHLGEGTRRLLPAVCLFHGVADADVLGNFSQMPGCPDRFAGTGTREWVSALEDAARVGLLTGLGEGMWQVHPALPAYLADWWRAEDPGNHDRTRDAATRALAEACAAFGGWLSEQIASVYAGLAFKVIGLQRRTLGAMLGYALDHQMWQEAAAIAQPLDAYWDARGLGDEAAAWTGRIQAATENRPGTVPSPDSPAGWLWMYTTGRQADRQRLAWQLDQAERTYRQILAMLQAQPGTSATQMNMAIAYHQLGMVAQDRGLLDDAEAWYRQSLAIKDNLGNSRGMASTYHQLGMVAHDRGRLDDAEDWYRRSLAIEENLGNQQGAAISYQWLGNVARNQGRLDDAENWYRKSLAANRYLGGRSGMADSCHGLGTVALVRRQLDAAEDWYRKSLAIREAMGDRPGMALVYLDLGTLAVAQGQPQIAEDWYRRSLAIREDLGDRAGAAELLNNLGGLALDYQGRPEDAEDWHRRALAIREDLGDRSGVADSYHNLGGVAQVQGRLDDAEDWYRKSLTIKKDLQDRPRLAHTYRNLGLLAEQRGHPLQALEWMIRCVTLFGQVPTRWPVPESDHLARLAAQLGIGALEQRWQKVTDSPLPQAVRDYVTSHQPGSGHQEEQ
jgi:tetratricopeptide (TPR) repeat protein